MVKVLITGANGFLASNTILALVNKGYHVRGLLRNKNKFIDFTHPNLELLEGDITNTDDVENAVAGCDQVIHAAAITDPGLLYYEDYYNVNIKGTSNILDASIKYNIEKIVYVGTANIFGYGTKKNPGDETKVIQKPFSNTYYSQSKLEGQKLILSASGKIHVIVVNPTFMLGPYNAKTTSDKIVLIGLKHRLLFYPPGGKNFIHVKDVVKGLINALEKGRNGEAYLLANENLTYREFFQKLTTRTNKSQWLIQLPKIIILLLGVIGEIIRSFGIRSPLSFQNMQILSIKSFYSSKKAKDEGLLQSLTPIEKAIDDTIAWLKESNNKEKTNTQFPEEKILNGKSA